MNKAGRRRFVPGQTGQAVVEMAVALPLLLILLFGIIDFGRALQAYVTINNASREGARAGSVDPAADITSTVRNAAGEWGPDVTVVVSFPSGQDSGDSVVVDVSYDYEFITPVAPIANTFFGGSMDNGLTLETSSDMRIE
jgi:Flp pilus assembly protein TadG